MFGVTTKGIKKGINYLVTSDFKFLLLFNSSLLIMSIAIPVAINTAVNTPIAINVSSNNPDELNIVGFTLLNIVELSCKKIVHKQTVETLVNLPFNRLLP